MYIYVINKEITQHLQSRIGLVEHHIITNTCIWGVEIKRTSTNIKDKSVHINEALLTIPSQVHYGLHKN